MIYGIEFGLVLVAVALAFSFPGLGSRWFEAGERALGKLAERPRLAVAVSGLSALAARAALLPILPIPVPAFHDEFCYLLAADTFAHGRLANPTHPLWIHFETFYVLWHPAYASRFPPAQGLIMALGQVVLGHPFWGVWLSLGLMCAALCWMLQGWLPPKWALLGGLLAVIRLATFSYWANSYWGGAVAATGGALVLGALPRLKQSLRVVDALLLGLGLAILANSRPYEGLVFSLPVGVALLVWIVGKNHPPFRAALRQMLLPLGLLLGLAAVMTGYYYWRVTGSPWRMAHQVYSEKYHMAPHFLGEALPPMVTYHHAVMKDFYLHYELPWWEQTRSAFGVVKLEFAKVAQTWVFYVYALFTLPLLMALAILPPGFSWGQISPNTRFLLVAMAVGAAGYSLEISFFPHYIAPVTCLIFALVLGAMRGVRSWRWRQKPVGLAITRAVPVIAGVLLLLCAGGGARLRPRDLWPATWCSPTASKVMLDRARILAELEKEPGRHLVIVRYSATHDAGFDWVYNGADIDGSKVIWARDMGREQNAELLRYFQGRRIWLVEPDVTPPRLSAYPAD